MNCEVVNDLETECSKVSSQHKPTLPGEWTELALKTFWAEFNKDVTKDIQALNDFHRQTGDPVAANEFNFCVKKPKPNQPASRKTGDKSDTEMTGTELSKSIPGFTSDMENLSSSSYTTKGQKIMSSMGSQTNITSTEEPDSEDVDDQETTADEDDANTSVVVTCVKSQKEVDQNKRSLRQIQEEAKRSLATAENAKGLVSSDESGDGECEEESSSSQGDTGDSTASGKSYQGKLSCVERQAELPSETQEKKCDEDTSSKSQKKKCCCKCKKRIPEAPKIKTVNIEWSGQETSSAGFVTDDEGSITVEESEC